MFKMSLRELFLIVALAAVGLGWWLDRSTVESKASRYKAALMKLRNMGLNPGNLLEQRDLRDELEEEWQAESDRLRSSGKRVRVANGVGSGVQK